MTSGQPSQASGFLPQDSPDLEAGSKNLVWSRILGKFSACIFLIAALAVVDGLQTLMRQDFNSVSLIPGETVFMSGMMPQNATSHTELIADMEDLSGLTFKPVTSFKGFWMGGSMWRAELTANATAAPVKGTLTVVDMVPMKKVGKAEVRDEDRPRQSAPGNATDAPILGQNPALVYSVSVWPSAAAREAAEHSLLRRFTGQAPFAVAGVAAALALLFGLGNFICFAKAETRLARQGVYVIHGVKKQATGLDASFAHAGQSDFAPGDAMALYDAHWREQARGSIVKKDPIKGFARFSPDRPPRYGWLVALVREAPNPPSDG